MTSSYCRFSLVHLSPVGGSQMRLSAFSGPCRFLSIATLGAMLALAANAQTSSESQTPSTGTPGSESQSNSPGNTPDSPPTPSTETKSESPNTPNSSNPAVPEANPASKTIEPRKAAPAEILVVVSKPTQTMTVTVDSHVRYRWRVSTGATHYSTPDGSYTPFRMELMHYSREWDNAGMPHAIFFTQRGHSIRTILVLARTYPMGAFASRFQTQLLSINSSSRKAWPRRRLSLVDVILPDTEIQRCRRDGRSDFLGDFFAFDGELRRSSSSDATGEGATPTSTIRLLPPPFI